MSNAQRWPTRSLRAPVSAVACVLVGVGAISYEAAQLTNVTVASYAVPLQGAAPGTVTLDGASPVVVVAGLTSTNPGVVGVPSGVPIAPGSASGQFVATGIAPGCAKITAKLGDRTRIRHVVVHPASSATSFSFTVPNQILVMGGNATGSVKLNSMPLGTIAVSSSNPAVATVPATATLQRLSASFNIAARAEGCATITVTVGAQSVSRTVQVLYIGG